MKRMLVILLFLMPMMLLAQGHFLPSRPRNDAALYEGPVYGLKGGINLPRLYYTDAHLSSLSHDLVITKSASIFVEIPFLRPFTIAPELNYQRRGGSFSYLYDMHIKEKYQLQVDYVSVRVPVFYYMPISDRVKPYFFLSPDAGVVVNGGISLTHPDHELPDVQTNLNMSNIKFVYVGALGGAGVRFNIPLSLITIVFKVDAAINWGFLDTFSKLEHANAAIPLNVDVYNLQGKRYSRGLELHLSLGYFINKHDACSVF